MKSKIVKFLFGFLLLIIPVTSSAHNVYPVLLVEKSKLNLSPEFLLNPTYLNSPNIKKYLLNRMKLFGHFPQDINEIEKRLGFAEFFCINDKLYDENGRAKLHIWVPEKSGPGGQILILFIDYAPRPRSCSM